MGGGALVQAQCRDSTCETQGRRTTDKLISTCLGTKNGGEHVGLNPARDNIGISDGKVPILAICHRARVCTSRLWTNCHHATPQEQSGAATCCDRVHIQLRCLDRNTGSRGLIH